MAPVTQLVAGDSWKVMVLARSRRCRPGRAADPLCLLPVGQVSGDAAGLAVLGQRLDGVADLGGVAADDDGTAADRYHIGSGLPAHPAAAAHDHQFLPREHRHRHRPGPSARSFRPSSLIVLIQTFLPAGVRRQASLLITHRPASPHPPGRTSSGRLSVTSPPRPTQTPSASAVPVQRHAGSLFRLGLTVEDCLSSKPLNQAMAAYLRDG